MIRIILVVLLLLLGLLLNSFTKPTKTLSATQNTTTNFAPTISCDDWSEVRMEEADGIFTYESCSNTLLSISTMTRQEEAATSDRLAGLYRSMCGSGEVILFVEEAGEDFIGIDIRETLNPDAKRISLVSNRNAMLWGTVRTETGGATIQQIKENSKYWLRLLRDGHSFKAFTSSDGIEWSPQFSIEVVMESCVQIGVIGNSRFGTPSSTKVSDLLFVDFTRPEEAPSEVNFSTATITTSDNNVDICVNLTAPCYCVPTTGIARFQDNDSNLDFPLEFEGNTTQQCFTLDITEEMQGNTYQVTLENIEGGNNAIEGMDNVLELIIERAEGVLCGIVPQLGEVEAWDAAATDRFRNYYNEEQVRIIRNANRMEDCDCQPFGIDPGIFNIIFEDCTLSTESGFDDAVLGESRRRVVCAVLSYLNDLIVPNESICHPEEERKVNIQVQPSTTIGTGLPPFNDNNLAYASPYFTTWPGYIGIDYPAPWIIINSGEYPQGLGENHHHALVRINFEDYNWYTNLEDIMPLYDSEEELYDLYSVALHEICHAIGFASAFNNTQGLVGSREGQGTYFPFDQFLQIDDSNQPDLVPLIKNGGSQNGFSFSPKWFFNLSNANDMHGSCPGTGPDMTFKGASGNYPIHTGEQFVSGKSFSHLDDICAGTINNPIPYVMLPEFSNNTAHRVFLDDELDILRTIGYNINNEGCAIGAVADGSTTTECSDLVPNFTYTIEVCLPSTTISIPLEELMFNDATSNGDITTIAFIESHSADFLGTGMLNENGLFYEFTMSHWGNYSFSYALETCNEGLSNLATFNIFATPCEGIIPSCEEVITCEELNPTGPDQLNACMTFDDDNGQSECNLICNETFRGSIAYDVFITNPPSDYLYNFVAMQASSAIEAIPGWELTGHSPDYAIESNSLDIDLDEPAILLTSTSGQNEGIFTYANISANSDYLMAFNTGRVHPDSRFNLDISLMNEIPPNGIPQQQIFSTNGVIPHIEDYYRLGQCFTSNDDYNIIWFNVPISSTSNYSLLDNIELIEDNFTAGINQTSQICGQSKQLGGETFCMLTDVGVRYDWFALDANNEPINPPLHSYTQMNEISSNPSTFEVAPLQTTTYRLIRTITNFGGLPNDFVFCETEDNVTITVLEGIPDASFTVEEVACGVYNFTSDPSTLGMNHIWYVDDVVFSNQENEMNPTNINIPFGVHTIRHEVGNNCGMTETTQTVAINCNPCCPAPLEFYEGVDEGFSFNTTTCEVLEVQPYGNFHEFCDETTWFWDYLGDQSNVTIVPGSEPVTHDYQEPGAYRVCMFVTRLDIDGMKCADDIFCEDIIIEDCGCCDIPANQEEWVLDGFIQNYNCETYELNVKPSHFFDSNCDEITWDWGCSPCIPITVMGSEVVSFTYPSTGEYNLSMTVIRRDESGEICSEFTYNEDIIIQSCNCCPNASIFANWIAEGFTSTTNCQETQISVHPNHYFNETCTQIIWDWGDETITEMANNTPVAHSYEEEGFYNICMKVIGYDEEGDFCKNGEYCKNIYVDDCSCNCDGTFLPKVAVGFDIRSRDCFLRRIIPNRLVSGCDDVFWEVSQDGNPIYETSNFFMDYSFPEEGLYEVCMYVYRTAEDGATCEATYCQDVNVFCPPMPMDPDNLVKNPSFIINAIEGDLGEAGNSADWSMASGHPIIKSGEGCDDEIFVALSGNQTQVDAIQQVISLEKDQYYELSFCYQVEANSFVPQAGTEIVIRASQTMQNTADCIGACVELARIKLTPNEDENWETLQQRPFYTNELYGDVYLTIHIENKLFVEETNPNLSQVYLDNFMIIPVGNDCHGTNLEAVQVEDFIRVGFPYFNASEDLTSNLIIGTGTVASFRAGENVTLLPGFEIKKGGILEVKIEDCNTLPFVEEYVDNRTSEQVSQEPLNTSTTLHCFPNPFQKSTVIEYQLTENTSIDMKLYNITGNLVQQIIKPQQQITGKHQLELNASNIPNGIYYLRMKAGKHFLVEKLVILH